MCSLPHQMGLVIDLRQPLLEHSPADGAQWAGPDCLVYERLLFRY